MGCDIHIITEIKKDGKWQYVPEIPESLDGRNYNAFAVLANVRNYFGYKGIEPKGFPEDISGKHFCFRSERHFYTKRYEEDGDIMFIDADGNRHEPRVKELHKHMSKEEYDILCAEMKETREDFEKRYYGLCYSCTRGVYDCEVYDATLLSGHYEKIPYKELYPDAETFMRERYADEWNDEAQDYGYYRFCVEHPDFHSASYLSLQELIEHDYTDYTSNRYKMDRTFYNAFLASGGQFPEIFSVTEERECGDFIDCIREAFEPTVIVSWQKTDEEKKKLAIFCGIEEMKDIAKQYGITDYNDIRIVFAFDN